MSPDFTALAGTGIEQAIGALLTIILIMAVGALIISAILWAYGTTTSNWQLASKGRTGVLIALGTGVAAGAGVTWMNWLLTLGSSL